MWQEFKSICNVYYIGMYVVLFNYDAHCKVHLDFDYEKPFVVYTFLDDNDFLKPRLLSR